MATSSSVSPASDHNGFGFCQNLAKELRLAKLDTLAAFTHLLSSASGGNTGFMLLAW